MDCDRLRGLLRHAGEKPPRRAVLAGPGRLVADKSRAPGEPEVDVLSEICHVVFGTEPRDARALLDRALVQNVPEAWAALRDDLVWGYPVNVDHDHVPHVVAALLAQPPDECRVFACSKLIMSSSGAAWDPLVAALPRIVRAVSALESDVAAAAVREVIAHFGVAPACIADCVSTCPRSAVLFLGTSTQDLLAAHRAAPQLVARVHAHARALPAAQRYAPLAFLASLAQAGAPVDAASTSALGVDTLVDLRRQKFDLRVAAAAAVLAQSCADPAIAALVHVIETLAASLARAGSRGPAN